MEVAVRLEYSNVIVWMKTMNEKKKIKSMTKK